MENASKALLIAASVLIAILLIAFGMKIFTSTSGTTESVEGTMQTTEIAMFNNRFLQYVGPNKSATQVKALINLVKSSNATSDHSIMLRPDGLVKIDKIKEDEKYNIVVLDEYYDEHGYIKMIEIKGRFWAGDFIGIVENY